MLYFKIYSYQYIVISFNYYTITFLLQIIGFLSGNKFADYFIYSTNISKENENRKI